MTSLIVSVTFVILTLAANQLGPRLIPTFMADRPIQTVIGLFLGTILYVRPAQRSDVRGLVDAAFDAIRQAGSTMPAILIRLSDVLGQLAPVLGTEEMRDAAKRHLGKLAETATEVSLAPSDRKVVLIRIAIRSGTREGSIHGL